MPRFGRLRSAANRAANLIIPGRRARSGSPAYYVQQPSCQIPNLSHLFSLFLGERESGTFVEIGAYDGVFVSNSWGLAERNWRGLMAEPVPHLAERCRRNHRDHPGVSVVETAIGDGSVSELRLFLAGTLTTASAAQMSEYESVDWATASLTDKEIVVSSQTLDAFLGAAEVKTGFDVLIVDVEGFEEQVFAGFDLPSWAPRMVIVELADTHPDLEVSRAKDARLGRRIADAGYIIVFKDSINTVFVKADAWAEALGV